MDEILKQIEKAINNHAMPRPYDYWLLAFTALSVILSFCAIFATIKIAKKQTAISEKQTEIMEQQNNISLFKERYEVISAFSNIFDMTKTFAACEYHNNKIKQRTINYLIVVGYDVIDDVRLYSALSNIAYKAHSLPCLFHCENYKEIDEFIGDFLNVYSHIAKNEATKQELINIHKRCIEIDKIVTALEATFMIKEVHPCPTPKPTTKMQ